MARSEFGPLALALKLVFFSSRSSCRVITRACKSGRLTLRSCQFSCLVQTEARMVGLSGTKCFFDRFCWCSFLSVAYESECVCVLIKCASGDGVGRNEWLVRHDRILAMNNNNKNDNSTTGWEFVVGW